MQRFKRHQDRATTGSTHPVRPSPFPAGPFGSSPATVAAEPVKARRHSSQRVTVLLEATSSDNRTRERFPSAPLLGFRPLQRSTIAGARIPRRNPPTGTFRPQRFPRSRRLSSPAILRPSFRALDALRRPEHGRCAPGVPPDLRHSRPPFGGAGRRRPGLLSKAFSSPATSTCSRALLSRASHRPASPVGAASRAGASESRSQKNRCIRWELPAGTGLPEVLD